MQDLIKTNGHHICIFTLDTITASFINGMGNDYIKKVIFDYFLLLDKDYHINVLKKIGVAVPDFGTDKKCNCSLCSIVYKLK